MQLVEVRFGIISQLLRFKSCVNLMKPVVELHMDIVKTHCLQGPGM